jgi:hypothetical protein
MKKTGITLLALFATINLFAFDLTFEKGVNRERLLCPVGKKVSTSEFLGGVFQPSVISNSTGKVMVFYQGRINSSADDVDKVLVYNFSNDQGKSWSKPQFLTAPGCFWGIGSYLSNTQEGKEKVSVIFTYGWAELRERYTDKDLRELFNIDRSDFDDHRASILYRLTSVDNGLTWQGGPVEEDIIDRWYGPDNKYLAFFSPIGQTHVIQEGPRKGRYVIAGPFKGNDIGPLADSTEIYDYKKNGSCLIYSDDQGESWNFAGATPTGGNEASAVVINGGKTIMMVRRNNVDGKRIVNYSEDFGKTWTDNQDLDGVPSPRCLGVMKKFDDMLVIASPIEGTIRTKGWIGYSLDNGKSWKGGVVQKGFFSYADFTRIQGTDIYVVAYSHGFHGEFGMYAKTFTRDWLLTGQPY